MAKVLIVAPYVPHPTQHGGAIRSRVLIEALREDHEVHLLAAVASRADEDNAAALAAEIGIVVRPIPAHSAPRAGFLKKLGKWLVGESEIVGRRWVRARSKAAVKRLVDEERFDLCIVDSTWALPVGPPDSQLLFLHNLEYSMFARDEEGGRDWSDRLTRAIESRRLRDYERKAIKHHALTVVVSDHDRLLAQELAPKAHVEVVANSVDLDRLVPLEPPSSGMPMRILFVGSLDYPPNLEAVTELVEKHLPVLRVAFPDLVVRVVGKDPHGSGARFSGVAGVEIVGAVADVATYYRDSHAVYLPIRNGGGTRIKILEAWALGVPVLSTSVGCEGLQAQDGVHLRRFETPAEGVQALQGLESESATLRANGRALVESHYSHAAAIARLKTLVNELLGAQAG